MSCRVHKGQNSRNDHFPKSDVQQGIYLKLLLITSNPVDFLLIAKGSLVCNFKFLAVEYSLTVI